jgi:hypothetical protein
MEAHCRCGAEVHYSFNHLGCAACGAACCPDCAYELESTHYCAPCAAGLLEPERI